MPFLPWFTLAGQSRRPQFLLKDFTGRAYGVVEHYETGPGAGPEKMLLEFHPVDGGAHPWSGWDLERWDLLEGYSRELPDEGFATGLRHFLASWDETERDIRRKRALRAKFWESVQLAEKGYTVAFAELFPEEAAKASPLRFEWEGASYRVDDQYGIQPGDFREEVTLAFLPEASQGKPLPGVEPALLLNWQFRDGCEILSSKFEEEKVFHAVSHWMRRDDSNAPVSSFAKEFPPQEALFHQRLLQMRRQGVILQVAPKPIQS
jgi:hypothetical protein